MRLKICLQADAVKRKDTGTTQHSGGREGKGGPWSLVPGHCLRVEPSKKSITLSLLHLPSLNYNYFKQKAFLSEVRWAHIN
jgi:hypothetical protein